ncbi:MAG: SpoIID/LytB domain-containing protein [bacterium]
MRLSVITILFLLTQSIFALKEIEIEPIDCPPEITIKISKPTGTYTVGSIATLQFEEYLKGVVPAEINPDWDAEALKAQAVVARTYAVYWKNGKVHSDGKYLCNTECCQVWKSPQDFKNGVYPSSTNKAVNDTAGLGITYNNEIIDSTFFSHSGDYYEGKLIPEHYTSNTEYIWKNYFPERRKTITPENNQPGKGGHGAGLSQYGAKSLAEKPYYLTYQDILKHYYGPVPPYVKKVTATQRGKKKYESSWKDNDKDNPYQKDPPNPTRSTSTTSSSFGTSTITITIEYSEQMTDESGKLLELYLESMDKKMIKVPIILEKTGSMKYRRASGELTGKMIKENKMNGTYTLRLVGYHKYAKDWELDKDPSTFCYQNPNVDNLVYST